MTTETPAKASARERLLAAADELFYTEGVQTVGIDRIIEKAGVAKASLYNAFGSKDELVHAYLDERLRRRQERLTAAIEAAAGPRGRLLALFDLLDVSIRQPGYHGCAFINAVSEAKPGSGAAVVADEMRTWTRGVLTDLAAAAGAPDPALLAAQLQFLYDGTAVAARLDADLTVAATAKAAAEILVDAHCS